MSESYGEGSDVVSSSGSRQDLEGKGLQMGRVEVPEYFSEFMPNLVDSSFHITLHAFMFTCKGWNKVIQFTVSRFTFQTLIQGLLYALCLAIGWLQQQ